MARIAFDCDGTLIDYEKNPRHEIIDLLRWYLAHTSWGVIIWSGGGLNYAENIKRRLGFDGNDRIVAMAKDDTLMPEIAVDDQYCTLGKTNIFVGPKDY